MANRGTLGSLFIDVAANTGTFETDIGRAAKLAEQRSREMQARFTAAGTAIGASIAAIGAASVVAVDRLNRIVNTVAGYKDLSERIGDTASAVASLKSVSDSSGVALETIAASSIRLTANLSKQNEESAGASAAIKALGLDFNEFKRQSPVEQIETLANRLATFKDGAGKTAIAVALFGKSGAELIPVLNDLADRGARQIGLTDEQIGQADDYAKRLDTQKGKIESLAQKYAVSMIPALERLQQLQEDLLKPENVERAQKLANALVTIAEKVSSAVLGTAGFIEFLGESAAAGIVGPGGDVVRLMDRIGELQGRLKELQSSPLDSFFNLDAAEVKSVTKELAETEAKLKAITSLRSVKSPSSPAATVGAAGDKPEIVLPPVKAAAGARARTGVEPDQQIKDYQAAQQFAARAIESATRQRDMLRLQIESIGAVTEADRLRYEIENGQYRELDVFSKKRLENIAKEIAAAESAIEVLDRQRATAASLINEFSPGKTGQDFITQIGSARTGGQVDNATAGAKASEESRYAAELAAFEDSQTQILALGGDYDALKIAAAQAHQAELTRIEQDGAAARLNITQSYLSAGSQIVGNLSAAAEAAGLARTKRGFEAAKLLNIAQATISTAAAITNALAVAPYPLGVALAASAGFSGAVQIAAIKNAKFGGGRRYGGGVSAGGLYEVAEPGNPELIKYGSKTLLAMGDQSGTVTPARVASAQAGMAATNAARFELKFEMQNTVSDLVGTRIERLRGLNGEQVVRVMTEAVSDNANEFSRANSRKNNVRQAGRIG